MGRVGGERGDDDDASPAMIRWPPLFNCDDQESNDGHKVGS